MTTQHGNQPIHLNQLLALGEFLVTFGAVLLQFNGQLAKCSDDGETELVQSGAVVME